MRVVKTIVLLACVAALLCSLDLFYQVGEGEQAVITQLGEPLGTAGEPGLHVKIPFIQRAVFFESRVMGWKGTGMEISTNDNMPLLVDATARWRITDPRAFHAALGTYEKAFARLDDTIPSALEAQVRKNSLADLVRSPDPLKTLSPVQAGTDAAPLPGGPGMIGTGREKILRSVRADASRGLDGLGIELVDVRINRLAYQQRFMGKVYERMIAERKARAAAVRSEGEGKRAEIAGLLDKELQGLRSEAFKTSEEIRGKADAEATRIYGAAYKQDPEFYSFLKTLETYKSTPFDNTTLILGTDSDFYKLLKGPSK
jgi:modulator of FtsH protease HflC